MGHISYYNILEIPDFSPKEEIKRAYRRLAVRFHPDKNKDTEEFFKKIKTAYEYLIDDQKRLEYDKKLSFLHKNRPIKTRHGTDNSISLKITPEDIANESVLSIVTKQLVHCRSCNGTGCTSGTLTFCIKCNGSGVDLVSSVMGPKRLCSTCHGFGDYPEERDCPSCHGTGLVSKNISQKIKLSRNFQPVITIPGSGNWPIGNGKPGNLIINLVVEGADKSNLKVHGKDIKGELKISPASAVLGDCIDFNVYGSLIKVVVPPGSKEGTIIEMENPNNKEGSIILRVVIDIPKKISEKERELYTQLLKFRHQSVYYES